MNSTSIKRIIFRNLSLGGMVIALLAGIFVYYLEHNRIDRYIAGLALGESKKHSDYYFQYYNAPSDEALSILKESIKTALRSDLFILVEIYDKSIHRIIVENLDNIRFIKNEFDQIFPDFVMAGKVDHKKGIINDQLYIKVMSPIRDPKTQAIIGHFEGIYHVSESTKAMIRNRILLSVGQSIFIVLLTTVLLYPIILQLNKNLSIKSSELLESNILTIKQLGEAISKRDCDTNAHNCRVTLYCVRLAEELGFDKQQMQALIKGAFLHDLGKIGISDNILLKPGKLTKKEMEAMKQHVIHGVDIVKNNKWLENAKDVILYHHEKYDGSGYPFGLKHNAIPVNARVFAIADCFDALTSPRPYKNAYSFEISLSLLRQGAGSHFDPEFLSAFEKIAENLHSQINSISDEAKLNRFLDSHINNYFSVLN